MKKILLFITIFSCCFLFFGCKKSPGELYIYNAIDQISGETLSAFEKEFNAKIYYNTYKDPEDIFSTLAQNPAKYDIIFAQNQHTARMLREGWLSEIPQDNLTNFRNIMQNYTPATKYTIPYMSCTLGILYDESRAKLPVNSWKILWETAYRGEIIMPTFKHDSLAIALASLKFPAIDKDSFHIDQARVALQQQMGLVQSYQNINLPENMAFGRAILAAATSNQATMAIENGKSHGFTTLKYTIPEEGSLRFTSSMVMPKNAKNKELATQFIDFLMRPEISAKNATATGLTSTIKGTKELLPLELQNNETMHPTQKQLDLCKFMDYDITAEKDYESAWRLIKPNLWEK